MCCKCSSFNGIEKYPKLRFPEFTEPWSHIKLSDFTERVMRKNKNNETDLPLTISSKDGLVDQITFFNKTVASKDMSGYYLLQKGEYAYNKSYSVGYDFGSIKRLERYPMGALSTLYICFALTKYNSDYIKTYFDSLKWYKEIYMISAEGARNHGLLNVPTDDFFSTYHYITENTNEQEKIAKLMELIESRIQKQQALVDNLKKYKRGVLQKLFSANKYNWKKARFGDFFTERTEKTADTKTYPICSLTIEDGIILKPEKYFREFLITKEGESYKILRPSWFAYNPMNAHIGAIAPNTTGIAVSVSGYYNIFSVNQPETTTFWEEYLKCYNMLCYYKVIATGSLIEKQRVHYSQFVNIEMPLPSIKEQEQISLLLRSLNNKLKNAECIYNNLLKQKSGFLQKLFI